MPLNNESSSPQSRQDFCRALRTARERRGITLDTIAAATKIPASVFAALERGDLGRWPKGIFRRSFFRDYARMLDLPVAETCADFVQLFPDDGRTATSEEVASDVRLVLDSAWHGPRSSLLSRLLAAILDASAVVGVAAAIAWMLGTGWPLTAAIAALAYFSLATALLGESPAKWIIARRRAMLDKLRQGPAIATTWAPGDNAISRLFRSADAGSAEPGDEDDARPWITDAHRVGPAAPPQLRVRIKASQ